MKIGIGVNIHDATNELKEKVDILNLENPLYPRYLYNNCNKKVDLDFAGDIIVDGAYIDLNPAVEEPDIRKIVKMRVLQSISFAERYSASEVIFLSTYLPEIQVGFYDKGWIENSTLFWKEICEEKNKIRISICNTFERNPKMLLDLRENVSCDNFGLALDLGHALAYSEIDLYDWYSMVEQYIETVYIHSNNKNGDQHLGLNEGLLFQDSGFTKLRKYITSKNLIIKVFDGEKINESINLLRKI